MGATARAGVGTLAAVLDLYGSKRGNAQKAWGEARKRKRRVGGTWRRGALL